MGFTKPELGRLYNELGSTKGHALTPVLEIGASFSRRFPEANPLSELGA